VKVVELDREGRIGGEEFLLVLTRADERNVGTVVEHILNQLRQRKFSIGDKTITVTASFGVSGFQGKIPPAFARLVSRADKGLYAAKRAGRNRIEVCAATQA
jgi:diguanylate cyclase (GGDEF)-like protein